MSRIGKKPIDIPGNVKLEIKDGVISVEGPKGKLLHRIPPSIKAEVKENRLNIQRASSTKADLSLHGLTRAISANLIKGVTEGYTKELEIKGVGFKARLEGGTLEIALGFSHPVRYPIPEGITITTPKPTHIVVTGIDKVQVGEVAAELRDFYKPEPYTGKGIRYVGEFVRHKAGKTVTK